MVEKIYLGTSAKNTFKIVSQYTNMGVCLNMYNFNPKNFIVLEELSVPVFLDNGSFERFTAFLKGEMESSEYFNFNTADFYFNKITNDYEMLLKGAKNPKKIILTIPEVIGSAELTQELQEKYIAHYKGFEIKYGCKIIISLQFNPNAEFWMDECVKASKFINRIAPSTWIVGIPFGNDFKILQKEKNFNVIKTIFKTSLTGYKAHLFACGAVGKIQKYVMENQDFIYSIDASTIMNLAKYSHYLSTLTQKVLDIRALKGRTVREETAEKKREELYKDSGLTLAEWETLKYIDRFEKIMENFNKIMVYFKII